ncbi:LysM peptidoglycan-binding domain-containing protein [Limosilactobacillus ingluviei]|uniref:LysM peptidoglycan-binding domain-containing protein n=1 Tax=Limosilactobacillus ingluviei TaxID=148604 RepID=UPI0024B9AD60|nr:LysM domain-containing protein [Limosilactobacillus ingluviei]
MKKQVFAAGLLTAVLLTPVALQTVHAANYQSVEEQADLSNWVANTPAQISANMNRQKIDLNNLHGTRYVVQWGDTLSQISAVTGISVAKLAYDNNIANVDLIYVGQVLILNATGTVPTSYQYQGTGQQVACTHTNLNLNVKQVNFVVNIVNQNEAKATDDGKPASDDPAEKDTDPTANEETVSETSSETTSDTATTSTTGETADDSSTKVSRAKASEQTDQTNESVTKDESAASATTASSESEGESESDAVSPTPGHKMMKQAEYVKETIDYLQNDLEEQGVDITLQKDTKGMPKSKKHYKHVKVDIGGISNDPARKYSHEQVEDQAADLKWWIPYKLNFSNFDKLVTHYQHVAILYQHDEEDNKTYYDVYAWE